MRVTLSESEAEILRDLLDGAYHHTLTDGENSRFHILSSLNAALAMVKSSIDDAAHAQYKASRKDAS